MKHLFVELIRLGVAVGVMSVVLFAMLTLVGCPEAQQMMAPVVESEETTPVTTVAEVKEEPEVVVVESETQEVKPETEPVTADITLPIPPPTIVEVGFYRDEWLVWSIGATDIVSPGDTVHTKIVFSERMQYTIANDASARPALFFLIDDVETQYRMKRGGGTSILQSGDMKPPRGYLDDYIGMVTIPEDSIGTFALRISGETTSARGINIAETVIIAPFVIVEGLPVIERVLTDIPDTVPVGSVVADPVSVPGDDEDAAHKAYVLMLWTELARGSYYSEIRRRRREGDSILSNESFQGFFERVLTRIDISISLSFDLFDIQFKESPYGIPDGTNGEERWLPEVVREYLRLRFLYPEKSEEALLALFRESVRAGNTPITRHFRFWREDGWFYSGEEAEALLVR